MASLTSMKNIGKNIAKKLSTVGINTSEELIEIGSKRAFKRMKEVYPKICSVYIYTLEGAITDTDYNKLPENTKKELKSYSYSLKFELHQNI